MKILFIVILFFLSLSCFSQSKSDTTTLQIQILTAQNSRLNQVNEILNKKLQEYFIHNLYLVKDSARKQKFIDSIVNKNK